VIAWALALLTRLPWVADFRDPMVELNQRTGKFAPADQVLRRVRLWVERLCVRRADLLVFCTEGARKICLDRYPDLLPDRCLVIANGFEESHFEKAEREPRAVKQGHRPITLLHSGTIYLTPDRDPRPFFDAIARLHREGGITHESLQIILRAPGNEEQIADFLRERGISDIVRVPPRLSYVDALAEMLAVDGLLLFQGYTSNPAIPAKLYEYLRAKKPLLALVDAGGDTAGLLRRLDVGRLASLEDSNNIAEALTKFLQDIADGSSRVLADAAARQFSRAALTATLDRAFASVLEARGRGPAPGGRQMPGERTRLR
jgi:glycosyltransferase involved in cell wall biosynthesis